MYVPLKFIRSQLILKTENLLCSFCWEKKCRLQRVKLVSQKLFWDFYPMSQRFFNNLSVFFLGRDLWRPKIWADGQKNPRMKTFQWYRFSATRFINMYIDHTEIVHVKCDCLQNVQIILLQTRTLGTCTLLCNISKPQFWHIYLLIFPLQYPDRTGDFTHK